MKRAVLVIVGAVAVVAVVVAVSGGVSDDGKSSEEILEESQQMQIGATACMTARERRQLRRVTDRMERTSEEPSDPEFARLSQEAWDLMRPYVPGGSRYNRRCYDDAYERFKRRVAREQ